MTTLVGINAVKGKGGVILGSDMSRTQTTWDSHGDVAYRFQKRTEGEKIYVDDKREIAMCMTGIYDQLYVDFLSRMISGEIDFKKVVENGSFPELRDLNLERWGGKLPDKDFLNSLLVATRFFEPKLYTCFPLGHVGERAWTSVGSGSDYALRYILEQGKLIPNIYIGEALDLTIEALNKASQDLYTGGLDLVAVTKDGIEDFGQGIRSKVDQARIDAIAEVKRLRLSE